MHLTFLGTESQPNQSPTLFATDRDSYVVQGWIVTDPEILAMTAVPDDETIVEVPATLMAHLAKDGLSEVVNLVPPIVHIAERQLHHQGIARDGHRGAGADEHPRS